MTLYGDLTFDIGVIRDIRSLYLNSSKGTINLNTADNLGGHGEIIFTGGGVINITSQLINNSWLYFDNASVNTLDNSIGFYGARTRNGGIVNWGNSTVRVDYYYENGDVAFSDYGTSTFIFYRENNNISFYLLHGILY